MNDPPFAARVFGASVIVAGATVMAICLPPAGFAPQPILFAAPVALASGAAALKVTLPLTASGSTMSVSYAVDFAALLLLGPHETMVVAVASAFCQSHVNTKDKNPLYRTIFNMAALVLTVQGAGLALLWLTDPSADAVSTIARPLVGAATTYFVLNTGMIATAIALSTAQPILATWQTNFLWSAPSYFVGAGAAAIAATLVTKTGYWFAPLGFAPIYLTYRTYKVYMGRIEDEQRHVLQTSDLHLATIEALARAIDAKDQNTQMHIRRVQMYAAGLAKAVGLSTPAIQGVKTAALLHDIGKLAVPEHILSKPGPLTQEEFQKIRIHPQVGAEIIAAVPFPYPVAPLILSHHERWDGKGYPQGIAGEAIPVGARILTIVDYYDAVTTERPYHKALTNESAMGLLRHEAGRALDPKLVPVFIELLPSLIAQADALAREAGGPAPVEAVATGTTAVGLVPNTTHNAFENIALAHREIYALYEIAQSMGTSLGVADTMALISTKISKIVPWTGCALFLYNEENDSLKCRFASGADAPKLLNATLPVGHGLSGWVARNRRTLVNADPCITFDALGLPNPIDLKAAIICPLHFNDTFIGCLSLYHSQPNRYTEDHRRLLERIGEQAGAVIHNSIVFEQTTEDFLTHPPTALPKPRPIFVPPCPEPARAAPVEAEGP